MVSIRTELLTQQAEWLRKKSIYYEQALSVMEDSISWIRQQEFKESEELRHTLEKQQEELGQQKKEILILAEALQRICKKYDRMEQEILDSQDTGQKLVGHIGSVDLTQIRRQLSKLGMDITGK